MYRLAVKKKNRARLQIKWTDYYYFFLILTSVPGGPGGPGSPWRERKDVTKRERGLSDSSREEAISFKETY